MFQSGEAATVRVRARIHRPLDEPVVGILVRNRLGIDVFGTNTRLEKRTFGHFEPGDVLEVPKLERAAALLLEGLAEFGR